MARADAAMKERDSLKALMEQVEKENLGAKSLVSRLNKEISQQKTVHENAKSLLAKAISEKAHVLKSEISSRDVVTKERDQLKASVKLFEKKLVIAKGDLTASTKRVENFQKMLRKMKIQISQVSKEKKMVEDTLTKKLEEVVAKSAKQTEVDGVLSKQQDKVTTKMTAEPTGVKSKIASKLPGVGKPTEVSKLRKGAESIEVPSIPLGGFNFGPSSSGITPLVAVIKAASGSPTPPTQSSKGITAIESDTKKKEAPDISSKGEESLEPATKKIKTIERTDAATVLPPRKATHNPACGISLKTTVSKAVSLTKAPVEASKEDKMRAKLMLMKRKRELAAKLQVEKESAAAGAPPTKRVALSSPEPDKKAVPSEEVKSATGFSLSITASGSAGAEVSGGKLLAEAPIKSDLTEVKKEKEQINIMALSNEKKSTFTAQGPPQALGEGNTVVVVVGDDDSSKSAATAPSAPTFGSGVGFGQSLTTSKPPLAFGSSILKSQGTTTSAGFGTKVTPPVSGAGKAATVGSGGTFLNLTPPGSATATPLFFGSSSSIKLPTPKSSFTAPLPPSYGIFGQSASAAASSSASPFGVPSGDTPKSAFGGGSDVNKKQLFDVPVTKEEGSMKAKEQTSIAEDKVED